MATFTRAPKLHFNSRSSTTSATRSSTTSANRSSTTSATRSSVTSAGSVDLADSPGEGIRRLSTAANGQNLLKSRFGSTRVRSRHGNSCITIPDQTTFYHFVRNQHSNTEVYIGNIDDKLFIAWRGTQLTMEDGVDMGDVKQDLKCLPGMGYNYASVSWIRPEDSTDHISVHSGFIEQYDSVREDLWEITNQRLELFPNTSEIFIAGHSMGGALTTLCTLDFCYNKSRLDRPELKVSSYPLASPRIGNNAFHTFFQHHVTQCDRIVLENDVIPLIPPMYKHVGREIRLKTHFCSQFNIFRTHHYSTYLQTIVERQRILLLAAKERDG